MNDGKCATINCTPDQTYKVRFYDFSKRYGRYVLTTEQEASCMESAEHIIKSRGYLYREHPKF